MSGLSTSQSEANKLSLASFLEKVLGFTPAGAAGFLGNVQAESGFNPAASGQESNGLWTMGFDQWEGPRRAQLQQLATADHSVESDPKVQEQQIYNELTQSYTGVLAAGRTATDPAAFANIVNRQYEVSGDYTSNRENFADAIYTQLSGITLPGTGSFSTSNPGAGATSGSGGTADAATLDAISIPGAPSWLNSVAGDALNPLGSIAGAAGSGVASAVTKSLETFVGGLISPLTHFVEDAFLVLIGALVIIVGLVLLAHAASNSGGGKSAASSAGSAGGGGKAAGAGDAEVAAVAA